VASFLNCSFETFVPVSDLTVILAQLFFAACRSSLVNAHNMCRYDFEVSRLKWALIAAPQAAMIDRQTTPVAD